MATGEVLPDNPLKQFTTYSTYFIIKAGSLFSPEKSKSGYESAILLLDTRGEVKGAKNNKFPQLSVTSFEVDHVFCGMEARVAIGLDATLVIKERGGASYLDTLGLVMKELGLRSTGSLVLWVGVGIIGWSNDTSSYTTSNITEKWFPFNVKSIDMEMKNSGSEYSHWLIGTTYSRVNSILYEQMNIKETIGFTMRDHLDDLFRLANQESNKAIESNQRGEADIKTKRLKFSYEIRGNINISAPIEIGTVGYDTGGKKHLSSGGKNGVTTLINHIDVIIKHTPRVLNDLKKGNYQYKIVTKTKNVTESEEELVYIITPYQLGFTDNGAKPLASYNYFYGGKNEDIMSFGFKLNGAFQLIATSYFNNTMEDINPDPERVVDQTTQNIDSSKTPTTPDSLRAGDTKQTDKTSQDHVEANGIVIPPKPKKKEFNNDMNRSSAEAWNSYENYIKSKIGVQLVEGSISIRGNPYLILDDPTVEELGLEGALNYVTLNIGTPLPDFNDVENLNKTQTSRFIYSGNYMIRNIKSTFSESGGFTQELKLAYLPSIQDLQAK